MSRFGKNGTRCDGCGIFTTDRDGYYRRPGGGGGTIGSYGRSCEHDYCDACENEHAPAYACRHCGARPDGASA